MRKRHQARKMLQATRILCSHRADSVRRTRSLDRAHTSCHMDQRDEIRSIIRPIWTPSNRQATSLRQHHDYLTRICERPRARFMSTHTRLESPLGLVATFLFTQTCRGGSRMDTGKGRSWQGDTRHQDATALALKCLTFRRTGIETAGVGISAWKSDFGSNGVLMSSEPDNHTIVTYKL